MRKFVKICTALFSAVSLVILSFPKVIAVNGKTVTVSAQLQNNTQSKYYTYLEETKFLGLFTVKREQKKVKKLGKVKVIGSPFGIKLYSDGVLLVDMKEFENNEGKSVCPAENILKRGDYLTSVNGIKIYSNTQLSNIIASSRGRRISVNYYRNGKSYVSSIKPEVDAERDVYTLGIFVKDSSAGLGTFTFYDDKSGTLAGLGHGVYDESTNKLISVNTGSIERVEINGIKKGIKGKTGEIVGSFYGKCYSTDLLNSENGIYCKNVDFNVREYKEYEVLPKVMIKEGKAKIITSLDNVNRQEFQCKIIKIPNNKNKNFTVKITDKSLIAKTGGIIQGMSGSPVIQNGKLVGALTHVIVEDPTEGYGIFAENMLETAQGVANENKLKDAS